MEGSGMKVAFIYFDRSISISIKSNIIIIINNNTGSWISLDLSSSTSSDRVAYGIGKKLMLELLWSTLRGGGVEITVGIDYIIIVHELMLLAAS